MLERFAEMKIGTGVFSYPPKPSQTMQDKITGSLIQFYSSFALYRLYNPRQIDGAVSLATQYALWTLPEELRTDTILVEAYSLWLSVIWMLDGIFDSLHSLDMTGPKNIIRQILAKVSLEDGETNDNSIYPTLSSYEGNNSVEMLIRGFYEVFHASFKRYFSDLRPYRLIAPESFQKCLDWLWQYVDCLIDTCQEITDLEKYAESRLVDSAMMCVAWHLVFFLGIPADNISNEHEDLFKMSSLLVAYHNDILSFFRDKEQRVNNLVKCMLCGLEALDANELHDFGAPDLVHKRERIAIEFAITYTNSMYRNLEHAFARLANKMPSDSEFMGKICLCVVKGSHNWANLQKRYSKGIRMLECIDKNDHVAFDELFCEREGTVAGDPIISS